MPGIFQKAADNYRRLEFAPSTSQSREDLCCRCFQIIPKGEFACENCGAEYWRPRELALRSLIFPSWGDLCMKHYGFALFELAGYLVSWTVAVMKLKGNDPLEGWLLIGLIFVLEHPIDAILTYNIASKGLNHRRDQNDNQVVRRSGDVAESDVE